MTHKDSVLSTPNDTVISLHADPPFQKEKDSMVLSRFQQICLKFEPLMLYVVSMAQFLDIVNGASMTVAMLPIAEDLKFEVQQQQWLISSYALSFGGLLLIAGRMGDLFGHRRVFLSGLFWFGLWSMINGFSRSPIMLCISRAFQGMGAAAQIPTALALIAIKYPAGKARTQALSVFGAIGAMGAVTGLLLSGALTSTIGWQWIFYISAILSAILFVIGVFAIPNASGLHGESPRIDVGGAFTVTGGVETGWASAKTLPVLCVGIVLLAIFIMIEKRISYPIMPFHIWKHRAFAVSFMLIFIMQAAFQGYLYYSTLIFQEVLGYSIMRTSLSYLVHGLSGIVIYSILGKFLPKLPLKPFIALGFICLACSAIMFSFVTETSTYWVLPFLAMIVNVFGLGLVMLPAQITALRDASDVDQGVVGAIYNVGLQIGAPFGLAILTVISGKLNGEIPGPERMHGYKYSLIGVAVFAAIGLVLTLIFLPHVKPSTSTETPSLEEGVFGNEKDLVNYIEVVSAEQGHPQKQKEELSAIPQKSELNDVPLKQELNDAQNNKEEIIDKKL
ncbi:hypothetical protein BGZ46_010076 [Entomortierella lignicola]|nr:hypothetical protein BGZ46_010076 [Entomortierella lignicola]